MKKLASLLCIAASLWCGHARAMDTDGDSVDDEDELGDFDGDGTVDWMDSDDDNDLVSTLNERQRAPASGDTDGDGAFDYLDTDDDNDGLLTMLELGPGGGVAPRNTDHDGKLDYLDDDDDNDGEPTATERQSAPPEPDVNHNGVWDYLDAAAFGSQASANPNEDASTCAVPSVTDAGLPVCWEQDHDGDGIWSSFEGSPTFTLDNDGDGTPDFLDADDDGDGIPTANEDPDPNHDKNPEDARNTSGNNPDYLNRDDDDDTIPTIKERPDNKDRDTDLDGRPNHLDDDDDGDHLSTSVETSGPDGLDTDTNKNGIPAYLDADEKYEPPTVKADPDAGSSDAGVTVIASLDGGHAASQDGGSSTRRDASTRPSGDAASTGEDETDASDEPGYDPDVPQGGHKDGGCGLVARQDETALGAFSSTLLLCVLALFRSRAEPRASTHRRSRRR